jgi:hypothetical protein
MHAWEELTCVTSRYRGRSAATQEKPTSQIPSAAASQKKTDPFLFQTPTPATQMDLTKLCHDSAQAEILASKIRSAGSDNLHSRAISTLTALYFRGCCEKRRNNKYFIEINEFLFLAGHSMSGVKR